MNVWLEFGVCALIVAVAGPALSRSADIIADRTNLSRSWIGLVLLGTITSLPELATGVSSVTVADVPDIAVGDALGSIVFNLLILVVVDLLYRQAPVYQRADQGHVLSAAFGVILIGVVGLNLATATYGGSIGSVGHVGAFTPIVIIGYLLAMRTVFMYERGRRAAFVEGASERYPGVSLGQAMRRCAIASVAIVGAGVWLPFVGADLADAMGWGESFVGSLFVAGATSMPELVVTAAAIRIGALDLAIANLLGSNLFDILVLAVDDLLYFKAPILSAVSPSHGITAASAIIMTGLVIVSVVFRPGRRLFRLVGWTSLALIVIYVLNGYVIYLHGK